MALDTKGQAALEKVVAELNTKTGRTFAITSMTTSVQVTLYAPATPDKKVAKLVLPFNIGEENVGVLPLGEVELITLTPAASSKK